MTDLFKTVLISLDKGLSGMGDRLMSIQKNVDVFLSPQKSVTKGFRASIALLSLLALSIPVFDVSAATQSKHLNSDIKQEQYWVTSQGHRVGTLTIKNYTGQTADQQPVHVTELEQEHFFKRQGKPFNTKTTSRFEEHPQTGEALRFSHQVTLANEQASQARGEIHENQMDLTVQQYETQLKGAKPIAQDRFSFPTSDKIQKRFQAHYDKPVGTKFQYQTLNLALSPELVEVEAQLKDTAPQKILLADGSQTWGKAFAITNPLAQGPQAKQTITEWRGADGRLLKADSPTQKTEMIFAPFNGSNHNNNDRKMLPKKNRLAYMTPANQLDVITSTQIRTNRMIPHPRRVKEATFLIKSLSGGGVPVLVENDRQKIVNPNANAGEPIQLKVNTGQLKNADVTYPVTHKMGYVRPSSLIESEDPELQTLAKGIVKGTPYIPQAAEKLRLWVYENITNKNLAQGFLSAKSTYLKREGDCTEHAILLAALTRSVGIPSRVAVGVTYLPTGHKETGAFVFHMWTEVFVGKNTSNGPEGTWLALDATNPEPFVDATHIKFADNDLASPNAPIEIADAVLNQMGGLEINLMQATSPAYTQAILDPKIQRPDLQTQKIDLEAIDIKKLSKGSILSFRTAPYREDPEARTQQGYLARATDALYEGRVADADKLIERAMQEAKVPLSQMKLAIQLASLERFNQAEALLTQASQGDSDLASLAAAFRQEYLSGVGNHSQFNEYFKAVGNVYRKGHSDETVATLKSAADSGNVLSMLHLGDFYLNNNEPNLAMEWFRSAENAGSTSMSLKARALDGQGSALAQLGKHSASGETYYRGYQVCKNAQTPQGKRYAELLYSQYLMEVGRGFIAQGDKERGWTWVGKGLYHQSRLSEAITAFDNATKFAHRRGHEADGYLVKLVLDSHNSDIIQPIKGMLQAHAHHGMALAGLAYAHMRARHYDKAISSARRAQAVSPLLALGHEVEAETLLRRGKREQALLKFERAIAVIENGPNSLTELRYLHLLREKQAKAAMAVSAKRTLVTAEDLIKMDALDPVGYRYQGEAYLQLGQFSEAKKALSQALALDPNQADVLTLCGKLYHKLASTNEALHYYEKALALSPHHPEASRGMNYLIEEQHLNRTKAPVYIELTDDEKDYLGLFMKLGSQTVAFKFSTPDPVGQIEGTAFETDEAEMDKALSNYNRLNAVTPPESLRTYHALLLNNLYQANLFLGEIQDISTGNNGAGPEVTEDAMKQEFSEAFNGYSQQAGQVTALIQGLLSRLNPLTLAEIQKEFRLPTQSEMQAQVQDMLKTQLDRRSGTEPSQSGIGNAEAKALYDQGVQLKSAGHPEEARAVLNKAIEADPNGDIAKRAKRFIKNKLPKTPATEQAVQQNIEGYNQWQSGNTQQAEKTFLSLIQAYPEFEWPYGNLGRLFYEQKQFDEAERYLQKALSLNENYLNGWLHLKDLYQAKGDQSGVAKCVQKIQELDPDSQG
jgi:tetratricopeptide (TPR) repeat protein